jgi:hypothetical protein
VNRTVRAIPPAPVLAGIPADFSIAFCGSADYNGDSFFRLTKKLLTIGVQI